MAGTAVHGPFWSGTSWLVEVLHGKAGEVRRGATRSGGVGSVKAWRGRQGEVRQCVVRPSEVWIGAAGEVR